MRELQPTTEQPLFLSLVGLLLFLVAAGEIAPPAFAQRVLRGGQRSAGGSASVAARNRSGTYRRATADRA